MSEKIQKCDMLIIGAGPAGLTAAIYAAWLGLKTVVLETGIAGGRAWLALNIENFPGFPDGVKGSELSDKMTQTSNAFSCRIQNRRGSCRFRLKGRNEKSGLPKTNL